ncbi:DUF1697 domain-containing protein [Streptomyces sudanensis]|uniref:DUF1697 domain-containing protein n=1 Tax=Streptomyces sudanensis TaxID=436397 RepID=UPI0020CD75DB|nr:DUF1697 domain-containing protein [Streptomyces sudanensis]MCP9956751.1 DUF1697 domain-containing protein [Streptomyces sudanensis]MCP9985955.1 DUF1697 domain-containing protein [Streptomyces sudanensis]MCQ0002654.1 DUF1697 domain-containing protein [Streptomyces sudanensis]
MTRTTRYAVLLRGVNVGGPRRVPMAELRALLTGLGHTDVRTYLQSGNAAFTTASGAGEDALAAAVERALEDRFGFPVDCLVRGGPYLRAVVDACPFPAAELEGRQLHVTYFSAPVTADRFAGLDAAAHLPEEFRLGDRALYLYTPDGLGRSTLAAALARPSVVKGLVATTRNWNTVRKLAEMAQDTTP